MNYVDTAIIGKTLQKAADLVCPTMGPKGRLAVISDEFSRPYLTDDGVTVAKELLALDDPFEKMVAISVVEASSNTERSAFDGTTLTVLLLNELYKAGAGLISEGVHPQTAADIVLELSQTAVARLSEARIKVVPENAAKLIRDVSYITTKIPAVGELVYQAYLKAGDSMNVVIEHDRERRESSVEHIDGMVVDSGYFSKELEKIAGPDRVWRRTNAKVFLLSEGILTPNGLKKLFASIPDKAIPLVFVFDRNYSPEMLKGLIENLSANKLDFCFVFVNDQRPDEVFLDIAAKTGGRIQSAAYGTTDYLFEYAGTADSIEIEVGKTTIVATGDAAECKRRMDSYKEELRKNEFTVGFVRADQLNRRLANLGAGVTKIKVAAQSITEFRTIKFKLDDAIGAVRCALRDGVLLGGGKALYLLADQSSRIGDALRAPALTILGNAGIEPDVGALNDPSRGLDARSGLEVDLYDVGILDSYTSIETALKNAASIACSYLRSYVLINGLAPKKEEGR